MDVLRRWVAVEWVAAELATLATDLQVLAVWVYPPMAIQIVDEWKKAIAAKEKERV